MFKFMTKMSGPTGNRLKSVIIVPKKSNTSKVIDEKTYSTSYSHKLIRLKNLSQSNKEKFQKPSNNHQTNSSHEKQIKHKKNGPSLESLLRHANYRPLGVNDDWGPLTHKHELMPMDNVRYWHQHRCEICDKLFEHKHKQRGDQSMNYNKHICNFCGGTPGSRRVIFKNGQSSNDWRKNN